MRNDLQKGKCDRVGEFDAYSSRKVCDQPLYSPVIRSSQKF